MPDPTDRLPEETLSAEALRLNFAAKGMSARELVALSGAHTVRQKPLPGLAEGFHALQCACSTAGGTFVPIFHDGPLSITLLSH